MVILGNTDDAFEHPYLSAIRYSKLKNVDVYNAIDILCSVKQDLTLK